MPVRFFSSRRNSPLWSIILQDMEPIDRRPGNWVRHVTHFIVIAFLVILFIALLGVLIFVLYRIALVDRRLYSALFLLAFAGFVVFLAVKGIRRGKFTFFRRASAVGGGGCRRHGVRRFRGSPPGPRRRVPPSPRGRHLPGRKENPFIREDKKSVSEAQLMY
jgi:hypothetical protein